MTADTNIASLGGLACVHEALCCAGYTRGSLFSPNLIPKYLREWSNRAPRSRALMGNLMGPIFAERSVPLFNETLGPSERLSYLSSPFLTSVGSDSLPSHRKSGEQRPWSTLITCTPPRGSSLIRQMTVNACQACAQVCVHTCVWKGKLSYDNRRWANWILTPYIHTVGQPIPPSVLTFHLPLPTSLLPLQSPLLCVHNCLSP